MCVTITCKAKKINNDILVSVIDTGIGIAKTEQEKIFEKFKQGGDTLTDKPRGTGLGLPICRQIVAHHGGRIWVESEPGRGSNFSFTLPVTIRKGNETKEKETGICVRQIKDNVMAELLSCPDRGKNIHAPDDDEHIRGFIKQALEMEGYSIREAKDGAEAISEIQKEKPDLVILVTRKKSI